MAVERTLSIVKPDGVAGNVIGQILARFEAAGLKIVAARMIHLSRAEAEGFYAVHRERPFFKDLVKYMTSGPVVVQVLEGENAVLKNREIMGATDPKKAAPGTIRADLAQSIEANTVHGSDAPETAAQEIASVQVQQTYYTNAAASLFDTNYQSSIYGAGTSKFSPIAVTAKAVHTVEVYDGVEVMFRRHGGSVLFVTRHGHAAVAD